MSLTPAALGYRMPAEWSPHAATWLSWPRRRETWPGKYEPIPTVWRQFARTLARSEPVKILAGGAAAMAEAQALVGDHPQIALLDVETDDAWARDHGPTFLVGPPGSEPALVDWDFNAWGGKYPHARDALVGERLAQLLGRKCWKPGIVLEGGSIDVNGCGAALTTEQCLLNPNRNPRLTRAEIEQYLADYLGVRHVLWLGEGIVGDDTDGHVDDLTRFVAESVVVTAVERDPQDVNYRALQDNFRRLQTMTDQNGRPLEVIPLPMPGPVEYGGQRLPASYANFYIANRVVVTPTFRDPADAAALAILQRLFPDREVIGLDAVDLVWGRGTYHCISQQEPALPQL